MKLKQLSCFFVLTAKSKGGNEAKCVVKSPLDLFDDVSAPIQERTKNLVKTILENDSSALSLYIDMAFQTHTGRGRIAIPTGTGESAWSSGPILGSGLYERLLVATLDDPQVLETASMLINLIPEEYEEERIRSMRSMIASFKKAAGSHGG